MTINKPGGLHSALGYISKTYALNQKQWQILREAKKFVSENFSKKSKSALCFPQSWAYAASSECGQGDV